MHFKIILCVAVICKMNIYVLYTYKANNINMTLNELDTVAARKVEKQRESIGDALTKRKHKFYFLYRENNNFVSFDKTIQSDA